MIKASTVWKEKMTFVAEVGEHSVVIDAKSPLGSDSGPTPKELVVIGVCGCTAMDVAALLKKHKQPLEYFAVTAEVESTEGVQPSVFRDIALTYTLRGKLDKEKVRESVLLSQTKYCGVSAMIAKSATIRYKIILNEEEIDSSEARFASESINFKRELESSVENAVAKIEAALKIEGFGILTRIDFDKKMKEKLNKELAPVVILGACAPAMAYEAFQMNKDVTSLLPCNVVVREIGNNKVSVEAVKPSAMMKILGEQKLVELAKDADDRLARALAQL